MFNLTYQLCLSTDLNSAILARSASVLGGVAFIALVMLGVRL
jgi:hypothetical protein